MIIIFQRKILFIKKSKLYYIWLFSDISRDKIENYKEAEKNIEEIEEYNIIFRLWLDKYIICSKEKVYFVVDLFNQTTSKFKVKKLFKFRSKEE